MASASSDAIQQAVAEALEEAKAECESDRLVPFTAAEIRFIQAIVAGALRRTLTAG